MISNCNIKWPGACVAGALLAGVVAAAPALAQNAPPPTPTPSLGRDDTSANTNTGVEVPGGRKSTHSTKIEEIVVTSQFRRQKVQNTPIAITAISGSTLAARSQTNVTQIATAAPNVNLSPAGSGFGSSTTASIRGVGQYDFNPALEPGVGFYVDDVYYGALFGSEFNLLDLDRVEVLRGPQGTLAGKNSIGGAIKLFSKQPGPQTNGYLEADYGAYNLINVRGGSSFTIIPDQLWVRATANSMTQDGFFERLDYACVHPNQAGTVQTSRIGGNCKLGTEGGTDLAAGRLAAKWTPNEDLEVNIIGDVSDDNSEVQPTKLIYQNNPAYNGVNYVTGPHSYTSYATYTAANCTATGCASGQGFSVPPVSTVHSWGVSGEIVYKLPLDLTLTSITAYRKSDGTFSQDVDSAPIDVENLVNIVTHEQFTQELRLSGKYSHWLDYTVGGYYYYGKDLLQGRFNILLAPDFYLNFLDNDPIHTKSYSGFGTATVHVTDQLNITGGLRYTEDSKSYTYSRIDPTTGMPAFFVGGLNGFTGDYPQQGGYAGRTDYRIDVDYRWAPELMTYVEASTGFKGGGVNPRPFFISQALPFGPEDLTAFEAGFKSNLFDNSLQMNGAAFYNQYHDIQLTLLTCPFAPYTPCALPANVANAHIKGLELETIAHPYPGLSIDSTVSYLDFHYTGFAENVGVTNGMVAPFTNKFKASFGVQYAADLGEHGTFTPRVDWSYQSSFFTNAVNSEFNKVGARGLVNLKATYTSENGLWSVTGGVTNLFDKFYYLNKFDLSAAFGVVSGQPGAPREWTIGVVRRF